jgi:hypothetical protein
MPTQIVENLLHLYTDVGSIVLDPFAGSGTTIDLGNLSDAEIFKQAIKLNCEHGYQLEEKDKQRHAQSFWRKLAHLPDKERYEELCELFSVSQSTIERWTKDQRREEKEQKQSAAWDLWLDCWSYREIALAVLQDE